MSGDALTTSDRKTVRLNDGTSVPIFGYGTGFKPNAGADITMAITQAGVRHIDCAERYKNEESVGEALNELGMKRNGLFVTSKLEREPHISLTDSLKSLGLEQVNLYLIHSPMFVKEMGLGNVWREMERLQTEGKARSIGVSNYRIGDLEETLKTAKVVPSVNQFEVHPYVIDTTLPLIEYCHSKGIRIASFSAVAPITRFAGGPVDQVVQEIASQINATDDQVLLKWAHQITHGGIVVTTSQRADRLQGQIHALEGMEPLTETQMDAITSAGRSGKHQRVNHDHMDL